MMRGTLRRMATLFTRGRAEQDLDEEVRFHLDTLAEEYQRKGMSATDAQYAARRDFGGVDQMKEAYRERRGILLVETTLQDIRYGLRGLRRSPGFAIAVVVSLVLGIGANTAVFSLLNTLMLKALPVREPERLVSLYRTGGWGKGFTSYPLYLELQKETDLFAGVLARSVPWRVRYSTGDQPYQPAYLFREFVSANYFEVLGVRPVIGNVFAGSEAKPQTQPLVVLSYAFWQRQYNGDPDVLGRSIIIDDQPLTIIGVAQKRFEGVQVEGHADAWVPITMHRARFQEPGMQWLWVLARLNPGIHEQRVQAKVDVIVRNFLAAHYGQKADTPWRRKSMEQRLEVRAGGVGISFMREQFQRPLALLMSVVGLVLLIACSNIANLLLARGVKQRREIAMRISLGASRIRLLRQSFTETAILGALGMIGGVAVGVWGSQHLVRYLPANEASLTLDVKADLTVVTFTACVSLLAMVLFGLLPAFRSTAVRPNSALKEGSAIGSRGGRHRLRKALVVTQVALSVVLVSGATLFSRSLFELATTDLGFRHFDVLSFQLDVPRNHSPQRVASVRERLLERAAILPGVTSATSGFPGPYQGGTWSAGIVVPGSERTATGPATVELQSAGPRYFETIGGHVRRGRDFSQRDIEGVRRVAIVNEAFAREYFNGTDPVGRIISFDDKEPGGGSPIYIVGEVGNMLHHGVRERPVATVYLPARQAESASDPVLLVRSDVDSQFLAPTLQREMKAIDPSVTLTGLRTVQQRFNDSIYLDRLIAMVSTLFGLLSVVLAGVGVYGMMSYMVVQRTPEIGIRVALGAAPKKTLWLVVREGLVLIALGAAVGIPLALVGAHLTSSLVYGVKPSDPWTIATAAGILLLVGGVAAIVPGRRAALISPMRALRFE